MAEKNARSLNAEMAGSILEKGGFLLKEGATKLYLDESEFSFSCKEGTGMDKAKILAVSNNKNSDSNPFFCEFKNYFRHCMYEYES